jgi:hypothetical protein
LPFSREDSESSSLNGRSGRIRAGQRSPAERSIVPKRRLSVVESLMTTTAPALSPPSFRLVSSQTRELTEDLAKEYREMSPSPTERLLNEGRVKHLLAKAQAGLLVSFIWVKVRYQGKWYRMNAQHSSNMLCQLNGRFPKGLKVHEDAYEVDSLEGMALLFRQFDDRKSGRAPIDVSGAYQGLHPELADIPRDIAKFGIESVTWFNGKVEGLAVQGGDDQYSRFSDVSLYDYLHWMKRLNPKRELKVTPVGAAMFGTFGKVQDQAEQFWDDVVNGGIEFNETAPATVLYNWLKGIWDGEITHTVKGPGYYQGCIFAWNAFRQGKSITSIKFELVRGGFYKIAE